MTNCAHLWPMTSQRGGWRSKTSNKCLHLFHVLRETASIHMHARAPTHAHACTHARMHPRTDCAACLMCVCLSATCTDGAGKPDCAYMHTYMYRFVGACRHASLPVVVCACLCVPRMCACVHVRACACVCACLCKCWCVYIGVCACVRECI